MCEKVLTDTTRIDVLINNAGVFPESEFGSTTEAQWDEALDVNTKSMFFISQALTPILKRCEGSIINIASVGGFEVWNTHLPYNVSKAGVLMLTRGLAKILAPKVRVNAIAPGVIIITGEEHRSHIPVERIPMKRYGSVPDIMATIFFLLHDATYITGQIIPVDGGSTSLIR